MKGKSIFTKQEAEQIKSLIQQKLTSNSNAQKGIRDKIRKLGFYATDFGISGGYTVEDFLRVVTIEGSEVKKKIVTQKSLPNKEKSEVISKRSTSDEAYILDVCDKVFGMNGIRQHRFDFLRGDTGRKLPVDFYYPTLQLVIEYREKQHSEEVKFFDKRITSSGITRGDQRKKYDELRRTEIPKNGLQLIEFNYSEFAHTTGKRLLRNLEDEKIIRKKLKNYIQRK